MRRLLLVLPLLFCPAAWADSLSQPPKEMKLTAVPEAELGNLEPHSVQQIDAQRQAVARLLQAEKPDQQALGAAYGQLGALYHSYHLDAAAKAAYANAIRLQPDAFRWHYYAGTLASQLGQHKEAVEHFHRARKLNPDYFQVPLKQGESLLELNQFKAATWALDIAAKQPPLRALALYHLAQIDLLKRRALPAIERLEEVLKLDPAADQAHYPLAQALRLAGRNDAAREHLALAGKRLPGMPDPEIDALRALNQSSTKHFSRGLRAAQAGDYAQAAAAYADGLAVRPDNQDARVTYARSLFLSGDPDKALAQLQQVLGSQPQQQLALFLSGVLLEQKGQRDKAVERYRQLVELNPRHDGGQFCLANLLFNEGQFEKAAGHYRAAQDANPDIAAARAYELLAMQGAGRTDPEVMARLTELLAAHPEDTALHHLKVRLLLLSKEKAIADPEQAREEINGLVQREYIPANIELQALVAARLGHFKQAVILQKQVLEVLAWLAPDLRKTASKTLASYQEKRLPPQPWQQAPLRFPPPANNAEAIFREYLSPTPY